MPVSARVEEKRSAANRTRWLAMQLSNPDDRRRILVFANELDDEADALERASEAETDEADPKT